MTRLNKCMLIGITSLLLTCAHASSNTDTPANSIQEKVVVYNKNGTIYKFEIYFGNSKTPSLVNITDPSVMPKDVQKRSYASLNDFIKDRANIDNSYKNRTKKGYGTNNVLSSTPEIAFGYIPSTQALYKGTGPDACYKSSPNVSRSPFIKADLQVTSDDKQHSSSLSTENGVKAALGKFKAETKVTYSTNYASSTATGEYNLAASLYTIINTGIPANNNLTANGISLLKDPKTFVEKCGVAGVDAYYAGIITTLHMSVATKSHSTATSFGTSVSAGYGPVSISTAFKNSKSKSSDFTNVSFTFETLGNMKFYNAVDGAPDYLSYLALAEIKNVGLLEKCQFKKPDLDACAQYITNMASAVKIGMNYAGAALSNPAPGSDRGDGAEMLYPFEAGINIDTKSGTGYRSDPLGGDPYNPYITYMKANNDGNEISDPFLNTAKNIDIISRLRNAVKLIYQLNALAARAELMANIPDLTTEKERIFLEKLDKAYMMDAEAIRLKAVTCENEVMAMSETRSCDAMLSLAGRELQISLKDLPDNVYELYYKNGIEPGSQKELLFKNSIALQYNVNYIEQATGLINKDCTPCQMIRAANQLSFGLAYYNEKEYSDEFFGGAHNRPSTVSGYIFPSTGLANLGKPENTYTNSNPSGPNVTKKGVRWWQNYKEEAKIDNLTEYKASPLYFVYNLSSLLPIEGDVVNHDQSALFNKIIGGDTVTGDSSAKQKNYEIKAVIDGVTSFPSLDKLVMGNLFSTTYTLSGYVTTLNDKAANQCFAGVYLPRLNYPGKNKSAQLYAAETYGSVNAEKYLCNKNPNQDPNKNWTYFKLGSDSAYGVKGIEEKSAFSLNPIKNFFGIKNI